MNSSAALPAESQTDRSSDRADARVRLQDLLQERREIEIDHGGKIYRLRLTQANKLILTA